MTKWSTSHWWGSCSLIMMLMRSNKVDYDWHEYYLSFEVSYGCLNNNSTIAHIELYKNPMEHQHDVVLTFLIIDTLHQIKKKIIVTHPFNNAQWVNLVFNQLAWLLIWIYGIIEFVTLLVESLICIYIHFSHKMLWWSIKSNVILLI